MDFADQDDESSVVSKPQVQEESNYELMSNILQTTESLEMPGLKSSRRLQGQVNR